MQNDGKHITFKVTNSGGLLNFLIDQFSDKSRKTVKALLSHGMISVDNRTITQFDHLLKQGQDVTVNLLKGPISENIKGLKILFEDEHIIVIDKDAGLLSIATANEKDKTAFRILSDHLKNKSPGQKIFAIHRLDKDTSGVMMYAKNPDVRDALQDNWDTAVIDRIYVAVVEGTVEKESGRIISWLKENKNLVMYSSRIPGDGQKAITSYKVVKKNKDYTLLELRLETGRKNQIRVHMKDMGHSVIGDVKYGSVSNPIRRLGLHALILSFIHPVTKKEMRFETEIPVKFKNLFGK
jgi:23S rRNA pseudouridine1911/1915/1917 synthase